MPCPGEIITNLRKSLTNSGYNQEINEDKWLEMFDEWESKVKKTYKSKQINAMKQILPIACHHHAAKLFQKIINRYGFISQRRLEQCIQIQIGQDLSNESDEIKENHAIILYKTLERSKHLRPYSDYIKSLITSARCNTYALDKIIEFVKLNHPEFRMDITFNDLYSTKNKYMYTIITMSTEEIIQYIKRAQSLLYSSCGMMSYLPHYLKYVNPDFKICKVGVGSDQEYQKYYEYIKNFEIYCYKNISKYYKYGDPIVWHPEAKSLWTKEIIDFVLFLKFIAKYTLAGRMKFLGNEVWDIIIQFVID